MLPAQAWTLERMLHIDKVPHKLGTFLDNARRRADKLTPERRAELDALGMRW